MSKYLPDFKSWRSHGSRSQIHDEEMNIPLDDRINSGRGSPSATIRSYASGSSYGKDSYYGTESNMSPENRSIDEPRNAAYANCFRDTYYDHGENYNNFCEERARAKLDDHFWSDDEEEEVQAELEVPAKPKAERTEEEWERKFDRNLLKQLMLYNNQAIPLISRIPNGKTDKDFWGPKNAEIMRKQRYKELGLTKTKKTDSTLKRIFVALCQDYGALLFIFLLAPCITGSCVFPTIHPVAIAILKMLPGARWLHPWPGHDD